jgi:hypothetical protein
MPDFRDFELLKTDDPREHELPRRSRGIWIAAGGTLVAAAIAVYFMYFRRPAPAPPAQQATTAQATEQAVRPLGADADRIALPPLAETDPVVRELVRKISSQPTVLAWLATNGLIRNFVVVVSNVVEGPTPARHLHAVAPKGSFQVIQRNGQLFVDPRSYQRYDGIAAAAASLDPAGAARLYTMLKPRIQEAYAELGVQPASFVQAHERAIVVLLQTPTDGGPVTEETKGIGYRYANPRLEDLTAAQKQLLRTGPHNVETIQSALRQLANALGIPPERLPPPRH